MDELDKGKILANGGAGLGVGALIPTILDVVPPKYQPIASAGITLLVILVGLFQKIPRRKKLS